MTPKTLSIAVVMGLTASVGCTCRLGGNEQTDPPTITAVDPALGSNTQDVRVTVIGTGFVRLLVRDLNDETGYRVDDTYRATVGGVEARSVLRVDDEHLVMTIPAGLPEGSHDVVVISPSLQTATREAAYYATSAEAPVLTDVSPPAAVNDAAQVVSVLGTGFRPGAQLFTAPGSLPVVDLSTATPLADDPAGTPTATLRQVIVPAGLQPGPYTLAVRNPDGQRGHLADVFRVVGPASLSLALAAPAQVSVGQAFTIAATLDNTGGSAATQVTLDPPTTQGSGTVTLGAPTPATATVAAGASGSIGLPAQATGAGTLTISTRAAGQNEFSLRAVASGSASTQQIRVQQPAALAASLSASPAGRVSVGQTVTVTMQVQNTGEADAVAVAPSALVLGGSGAATLVSGPSPASATIPGGTSASFTFTYTASGPGQVVFTGTAQGRDGNSMQAVSSGAVASPALTVQTAADLSITAFVLPTAVARGQTFTATLVVANTGQADATAVLPVPSPPTQTVTGGAAATTSTALSPVTIPGGTSAAFTWTYLETGTAPGTLRLRAGVTGTDANSGAAINVAAADSNVCSVQAPGILQVTSFTIPATLTRGQSFTATITVRNAGALVVNNVLPSPNPPTLGLTGSANATTSTALTPVNNLAPGASATFSWTYVETGTGTGTLTLTAGASGVDSTMTPVSAIATSTNLAQVQTPAALSITSLTGPASISRGQTFPLRMTVQNTGQATATSVLPSPNPPTLTPTGGAGASTSTVLSPVSIPGGSSVTFTWSYTETGTGPGALGFSGGAQGLDGNTGGAISAPAATSSVTVLTPASLAVTALTVPARLSRGQAFTGTMTVSNTGQADAVTVVPQPDPPSLVLTGGAGATTSATQTPVTIPGGGSRTFNWAFQESGSGNGTLALRGGATGNDVNTGAAITAPQVTSAAAQVESPAQLQVTSFTLPATLSRGQPFQAVMVVTNTGQATASGVLPSPNPPTQTLTGGAGATTATVLTPATIAGGSSATFTWSYTENGGGVGTLQLTAGATGTDANSGTLIVAPPASTVVSSVQAPAALTSSLAGPPAAVAGDSFEVAMTVNNTGGATASNVTPSALAPTITGTVSLSLISSPSPVAIPGGGSATLRWTYSTSAASNGTVRFAGNATGTDANSGAAVASAGSSSSATAVIPPASAGLVSAITTRPRSVPVGDSVTVEMSVNNRTTGTISGVTPSALTLAGTGQAVPVSGPAPATFNLLAGETRSFAWTYRATAAGWVTFTGNAVATAPATASARATSPVLAVPSPGCHLSTLAVSAGPDRTITCNQNAGLGGAPTATGGNPSYVYEWSPAASVSNPSVANPTASPRSTGTAYTVTVTDGDGCQLSDAMVVTVSNAPTQPVVTSGRTEDRGCTGQNFSLTRNAITCSGGCTHRWEHGDGTTSTTGNTSHNKSYAAAGTYTVRYTATDGNGCSSTAALPVFVGTTGTFPVGRMTLTPSAASVAADGTSTITFTSQALRDCGGTLAGGGSGMRFLVMADRGTITNPDVDMAVPGIQVNQSAVAGGQGLSFTVRADRVGGPVRVRAQSVMQANSNARGWGTATFIGSTSLPQVLAAAPEGVTAANPTGVGAAFTKGMAAATVTGASVSLQEVGGGTCAAPTGPPVAGTSSYLPGTRAALFSPSSALDVLTRGYVMTLTAALQDAAGNPLDGNFDAAASGAADNYQFCFGDLPDTVLPTISCTSLLPTALSPDGDGSGDTSTMTVSLDDDVGLKSWRVEVRSESTGAVVRTLSRLRGTTGADSLAWDGRNESGQVVPNGSYQLTASALDTSDNRSAPCSLGLIVSSVLDSPELSPP